MNESAAQLRMLYSAKADEVHGHIVYRNRLTNEVRRITNIGDFEGYGWDDKVDLGPMDKDIWLWQASERHGPGGRMSKRRRIDGEGRRAFRWRES